MKIRVSNRNMTIVGLNLGKVETEIKNPFDFVIGKKEYFIGFKEIKGYLEPISIHEKPKDKLSAKAKILVIYKDDVLLDYGFDTHTEKDVPFVEAEIKDFKIMVKKAK